MNATKKELQNELIEEIKKKLNLGSSDARAMYHELKLTSHIDEQVQAGQTIAAAKMYIKVAEAVAGYAARMHEAAKRIEVEMKLLERLGNE